VHLARKLLLAQMQLTDNSARMEDMSSDNINLATPEAIHIIPTTVDILELRQPLQTQTINMLDNTRVQALEIQARVLLLTTIKDSSLDINLATPEAIHIIPILDTLVTNILTLVVANASMDIVAPTAKVQ